MEVKKREDQATACVHVTHTNLCFLVGGSVTVLGAAAAAVATPPPPAGAPEPFDSDPDLGKSVARILAPSRSEGRGEIKSAEENAAEKEAGSRTTVAHFVDFLPDLHFAMVFVPKHSRLSTEQSDSRVVCPTPNTPTNLRKNYVA